MPELSAVDLRAKQREHAIEKVTVLFWGAQPPSKDAIERAVDALIGTSNIPSETRQVLEHFNRVMADWYDGPEHPAPAELLLVWQRAQALLSRGA